MDNYIVEKATGEKWWNLILKRVKANDEVSEQPFRLLVDWSLLSEPIPVKLAVWTPGRTVVAHSEIRDLGTAAGLRIAGLSNTVVAPGYRRQGIYTALIKLRNAILDGSDFDCVAARVKKGFEDRYMAQYNPQFLGFTCVKKEDAYGAAWLLRPIHYWDHLAVEEEKPIMNHLETKVKKW